jgi:hypothetical protein
MADGWRKKSFEDDFKTEYGILKKFREISPKRPKFAENNASSLSRNLTKLVGKFRGIQHKISQKFIFRQRNTS